MNFLKPFHNQRGLSSILIVMSVGAVLTGFILALQMYISARSRVVARIRLAYKYTFIMEDAAKLVLNGRLEYVGALAEATTCSVNKTAWDLADAAPAITVCLPSAAGSDRCINGEACICRNTGSETDLACAQLSYNLEYEYSDESMVAFRALEQEHILQPAFENSIWEHVVPDFDQKYLSFVDSVIFKKPSRDVKLFNEAMAVANSGYTFATVPLITGPTPDLVAATSPYPTSPAEAFTYRDCSNNRCIDLRVCVENTKELSLGTLSHVCFRQRISRSFLWPHTDAGCGGVAGCSNPCGASACPNPADPDNPVATEKGNATCLTCPWRDRF